jgi:hypothetical protein
MGYQQRRVRIPYAARKVAQLNKLGATFHDNISKTRNRTKVYE